MTCDMDISKKAYAVFSEKVKKARGLVDSP